ncbi:MULTISPECIES: GHMP family kinase ATP-binding protein [unclassified Micromonospora]|uniref:GHMP family kinase ATP-binding protein n=1 Tax=unclassified Micromonospora TaxID=2617518 RepID=UPI001E4ADD58|nr:MULTISPECIES: kinase [unclassified Micromonospora]MCZ7476245.1 kinase [Micromonospora sp. WMMC273]
MVKGDDAMTESPLALAPIASGRAQPQVGTGTAHGTFGELLQGVLPDDVDFLVTLPIQRGVRVRVILDPEATELTVSPTGKTKSLLLARSLLRSLGHHGGGHLIISSDLPVGKGLASSSADLVAVARAVGQALGQPLGPQDIEALLRDIEPSDGIMYSDVVAFRHREVRLHRRLGPLPPLTIVGLDEGGEIDTVQFNRLPKPFQPRDKREYAELLDQISHAMLLGDAAGIGRVATRSAEMNQRLHPKKTLPAMVSLCEAADGLGVVVAHSGTAVGILLSPDQPDYDERLRLVHRGCAALRPTVWIDQVHGPREPYQIMEEATWPPRM